MDLKTLIYEKRSLEEKVKELIEEFEAKFNNCVCVESITIIPVQEIGNSKRNVFVSVEAKVK